MGKYDDIMELPHHQSDRRPHMSLQNRAAQFSPFAALTGYEAAISEAGRLTEEFREPSEEVKAVLDGKLQLLEEKKGEHPEVTVSYFQPDERKAGGRYLEVTGYFRKVDLTKKTVQVDAGEILEVPLDYVADIRSAIFREETWTD